MPTTHATGVGHPHANNTNNFMNPTVKIECEGCGQQIEAPKEILLESKITCPTCNHEFMPRLKPRAAEEKFVDRRLERLRDSETEKTCKAAVLQGD